jgi:esterase/lipase superfamily enzyme
MAWIAIFTYGLLVVAIGATIALYFSYRRFKSMEDLLTRARPDDRHRVVQGALTSFYIDAPSLSEEQLYALVTEQIHLRAARYLRFSMLTGVSTILLSAATLGPVKASIAQLFDKGQHLPPGVKGFRQVFFATDRDRKGWALFGEGRSRTERLTFGQCVVSIPDGHKRGELERPWNLWIVSLPENPAGHIVIQTRSELDTEGFYTAFNTAIDTAPEHSAFVFIHGYNVSFDDAIRRTAQLAWDMHFQGPAIAYSWPSGGAANEYVSDLDAADWTVEHLEYFLRDLRARTGVRLVHIVGHSMGSRVTTKALGQLAHAGMSTSPFQELVLAAPDIDNGVLAQLSKAIAQQSEHATIYSSRGDRALQLATFLRFGRSLRAGITPPVDLMKCTKCDFIDATLARASFLDHSYIAENPQLLQDLSLLLRQRLGPKQRSITLDEEPPIWVFRP